MRKGRHEKARRREDALERAKNYKPSKNPVGLRERVRRGLVSIEEASDLASGYNDNIRAWLRRRKNAHIKAPTNKSESPKKKIRGKQKRKNDRKNKKSTI
jgi:transposase